MLCSKIVLNLFSKRIVNRQLSSRITDYPPVKFTKIVHPGETQMMGKVQGGLMLKLLEASADIAATRQCLKNAILDENGEIPHPALVGIERVEMLGSAEIGGLMEFTAKVIQVKNRSLRIFVEVNCYSEKCAFMDGRKSLVNRAMLWYVPINLKDGRIGSFSSHHHGNKEESPPASDSDLSLGLYLESLKLSKEEKIIERIGKIAEEILFDNKRVTMYSIAPSHCSLLNRCKAGEILRWMDEFAAAQSAIYAQKLVVTGSLDNCIMSKPIPPGSCISFVCRPVFTSRRTIDMQVIGCMENRDALQSQIFANGYFTFVVPKLNKEDDFVVPTLQPKTVESKKLFEKRKQLHSIRKDLFPCHLR